MKRCTLFLFFVLLAACKKDEPKREAVAPPCQPAGKKLHPDGKVASCMLAKRFSVDGYDCEWGKTLELHPDGKLKACHLAHAKTIAGTQCHDVITLHPNGNVQRCRVYATRAGLLEGVDLRVGDHVTFSDTGVVQRIDLVSSPAPRTMQGKDVTGGTPVCFDASGKTSPCSG